MPAGSPADCDRLFEQHVNAGDVEAVVALYEEGGSLVQRDGTACAASRRHGGTSGAAPR